MWFTAVTNLVLVILLAQATWGQSPFTMSDPVFGITYDLRQVQFHEVPESLRQTCPAIRRGGRWWLYSYLRDGDRQFFVISSLSASESGASVVISSRTCVVGNPDWVLTGDSQSAPVEFRNGKVQPVILPKDITFSDSVLHGLASDLLRRYAEAFGGKDKFLRVLREDGLPIDDWRKPALRSEFDKFVRTH